MIWTGIGIGIGVALVHSIVLNGVLWAIGTKTKSREDETLRLMAERNELDRQKVEALWYLAGKSR